MTVNHDKVAAYSGDRGLKCLDCAIAAYGTRRLLCIGEGSKELYPVMDSEIAAAPDAAWDCQECGRTIPRV